QPETDQTSWPDNVSVLIPAYKAAQGLNSFLPVLLADIPRSNICVVDDGSGDDTESVCSAYGIQYLKQSVNRGKGAALRKGFTYLLENNAEWILTMDADGQHAIEDIGAFTKAITQFPDAGMIIGARNISIKSMPPARVFSNTVTSGILSALCQNRIPDSQCGYRIYSAALLNKVTLYSDRFEMESEVILKSCAAGLAVRFVPVQTLYCSTHSHMSHLLDMIRWVRAVVWTWLELRKTGHHKR
ncbi:MAG: glycosyltransferase family 2 protein, partial [bacterium]|nr:glycosyltransferase family 2 protein [bacterium]